MAAKKKTPARKKVATRKKAPVRKNPIRKPSALFVIVMERAGKDLYFSRMIDYNKDLRQPEFSTDINKATVYGTEKEARAAMQILMMAFKFDAFRVKRVTNTKK